MDCFLFLDCIRSTYDLNSHRIKLYYSSSIFSQVWVTDKLKIKTRIFFPLWLTTICCSKSALNSAFCKLLPALKKSDLSLLC